MRDERNRMGIKEYIYDGKKFKNFKRKNDELKVFREVL